MTTIHDLGDTLIRLGNRRQKDRYAKAYCRRPYCHHHKIEAVTAHPHYCEILPIAAEASTIYEIVVDETDRTKKLAELSAGLLMTCLYIHNPGMTWVDGRMNMRFGHFIPG
jgi:hypothetical protein